jgi:glucarate dehydratase
MEQNHSSRIVSLRATPVTVPTITPCAWSLGTGFGFTRTILEVTADNGLVGLGECEGSAASRLLEGRLGKELIGKKIFDLAAVAKLCRLGLHDYGCLSNPDTLKTYAAVEMAMWDLLGKSTGRPVFELLGGAARPRAEFGAYGYTVHLPSQGIAEAAVPDAMAAYAKHAIARTGAKIFEFKIGRYSVGTDIETIRAVRQTLGDDIAVGVDANQALELENARKILRAVTAAHLDWVEEPVALLWGMAGLSREFRLPVSTHCTTVDTMRHYPGIEGIVGDLHLQGGIRGMLRSASAFHALGHQFWQRSSLELGISWAAMVHASISCPDSSRPSQCLIDYVEDDLIKGPMWLLHNGAVAPPELPGLGVELDREAMGRYAETYRQHGDMGYFDHE